jgi:uncharacterized protein (UPF0332 family)
VTDENRRSNLQLELDEARRCREAADVNAQSGYYKAAVNRLYYACYHAARAILLTEGLEPKRHSALRHLLALHFVKTGRLPVSITRTLAHLEDERELADYIAASTLSREEYEDHRDAADGLLTVAGEFLRANGWV